MKKFFSVFLILLVLLCSIGTFFPSKALSSTISASTIDDVYDIIASDCLNFKREVNYTTSINLKNFNYTKLRDTVIQKNPLIGGSLYSITGSIKQEKQNEYSIKLFFRYYMNASEYKKVCKISDDIAKEMQGYTDYEKIKTTHDYLINNCNYQVGSDGPYNALFKGKSNCNGYALSFLSIMQSCGIECTYETGDNHAWNSVKLDGEWYNVDVTWDDSGVWDKEGGILYDNFLKNDSAWGKHHHGNSTAKQSYPADLTIDKPIKNIAQQYRIILFSIIGIGTIVIIFSLVITTKIKQKKKKKLFELYNNTTNITNFNYQNDNNHIINY